MASSPGPRNVAYHQVELGLLVNENGGENATGNGNESQGGGRTNDQFVQPINGAPQPMNDVNLHDAESQEDCRQQFGCWWEFLFSCISTSVGLGNVWRFPKTAFENGGGAFLIPYFIVLMVIGRPIYFLELTLGQFSSRGQVKVWKAVPFFKGVGYASVVTTICVTTYYVYIVALTVYYFFASFQATLPWSVCDESWAGEGNCFPNGTSVLSSPSIPSQYFSKEVTKQYDNLDSGTGVPDWKLSICLAISWLAIFGSLMRGVRSSGKVAYFTAIVPYVGLIILLIRGLTLPGAYEGIYYFIKPDFSALLKPKVWYEAVIQCFFSLTTGFGALIMFSSHNKFTHNIYRDSGIISIMDTMTSLLSGFTCFAVLGNLAYELGKPVEEVVSGGFGLAFISYPMAISKFSWCPQLFAVFFFLMLFTLGLGSANSIAGAIITVLYDRFPKGTSRWKVAAVVCSIGFLIGLVYTTPGGLLVLGLVDFYGVEFLLFTTSLLEVIGIAWVYGLYSYLDDVEFMLNIKLGWYWKICWGVIIPISLGAILVATIATKGVIAEVGEEVPYPTIALVFGILIALIGLGALPAGAIHAMSRFTGSIKEKFYKALQPFTSWGPRETTKRREWQAYKQTCEQLTTLERVKQRKL